MSARLSGTWSLHCLRLLPGRLQVLLIIVPSALVSARLLPACCCCCPLLSLPALAESTAASQAAEIKRLEDFVARFGAKASKASEAQSKLKVGVWVWPD